MSYYYDNVKFEYTIAKLLFRINFFLKNYNTKQNKKEAFKFLIFFFSLMKEYCLKLNSDLYKENLLVKNKKVLEQIFLFSFYLKKDTNQKSGNVKKKFVQCEYLKGFPSNEELLINSIKVIKNEIKLSKKIYSVLKYSTNSLEKIQHLNLSFLKKVAVSKGDLKDFSDRIISSSKNKILICLIINFCFLFFLIILYK
nr:hypothetical protein Cry52Nrm2_p159 [Cryptomonas curvata]